MPLVKQSQMPTSTAEKQKYSQHPEMLDAQSGKRKGPGWARSVVWALVIFSAINVGLWNLEGRNKANANDVFHGTGSIDLAVNAYKALPEKPTVTLLGSSLIMFPFWSMDIALDRKNMIDIFHHHRSAALEQKMQQAGFHKPTVFSFAVFGEMVSDAYIYANEFLKGEKKPEFIVYGIAPRDFSDADLSSPMTTNTFKRLVNLGNFPTYSDLYLPSLQEKLDFVLGRLCYFYGHRWRLQQESNKVLEKAYILTGVHEEEKKIDFANAGFMLFGGEKERWKSSEEEYQRRYKNMSEKEIEGQMNFLKRLLEVARKNQIKVVVLNMPLAEMNRKILPPGFYAKFRQEIASACARPGVKFVDLGESTEFEHDDFWDTAHLGPTGGMKLLPHLVPALQELRSEETCLPTVK